MREALHRASLAERGGVNRYWSAARPAPSSCAAEYGNGDQQSAGREIAGWGAGESARASARTAGLVAARGAARARRCGAAASGSARDAGRTTRAEAPPSAPPAPPPVPPSLPPRPPWRAGSATACPARARLAARARARLAAPAPPAGAGASAGTATARTAGAAHASVLVERRAVERHDDDFAAVVRAGRDLVVLVHVGHGEGHVGDEPVLDEDARPLHLEPVVDGAVGVAEDLLRVSRIVGQSLVGPVMDAVGRGEVIADAIARIVVEDVVLPAAEPDHRILGDGVGGLDGRRPHRIGVLLSVGIDAGAVLRGNGLVRRIGVRGLLRLVGTTDPAGAERDAARDAA